MKTAGGRIELGSVAAPSLVSLTPIDQGWTLGYSGVTSFGDIKLSQQATVDASGAGGGDVQVFGRQVSLSAGSQIENSNLGDGLGGMLKISASDSVELTGISEEGEFPSAFLTVVYPTATGDGGNLTIETGQLTIRDGGQILGITEGIGNGSSLVVKASNAVELIGTSEDGQFASSLYASVEPGATGTGGNINIDTKQFTIRDGAQVESDTFGQKSAGNLTINATDSVEVIGSVVSEAGESPSSLFSFVGPTATGDGGNLTIETGRLTIQDGGQIFAGTLGKGTAGILTVRASDVVELIGTLSTSSRLGSSLATSVEPIATGDGGNLTIKTKRLSIRDGAVVSSATFGEGAAGSLIVKASDLVELIGASSDNQFPSRLTARTTDSRKAGDVAIGTRSLFVRDGAEVSVSSQGTGDAGNLEVTASSIRLDNGGKLTAVSASGEGGNIELTNQDFLLLRGNSEISTDATAGTGNGGNITIDSKLLAVLEKSNITANAIEGQGGNIQIETQGIFLSPNSSITASSERGINGVVEINRPDIEPTSGLIELPAQLVDVSNLIAQSCPTDVGPSGSRFVITGRGGLPEDPTKPLNKNITWIDLSLISPSENQPSEPVTTPLTNSTAVPLAEATGWVIGNDGQVVLTAAVLNSNLEIPWMTPTTCHAS